MTPFGQQLKILRKRKHLTQEQLAIKVGLKQSAIANYEKGQRFPDEQTLIKFAQTLESSLDELLGTGIGYYGVLKDEQVIESGQAFYQKLLQGDEQKALSIVYNNLLYGATSHQIYKYLILSALWKTGQAWSEGHIKIAQEHYISGQIMKILSILGEKLPKKPTLGKTVIGFLPTGEEHIIPLRIFCDLLEQEGVKTFFIGQKLPLEETCQWINQINPDALVLSITQEKSLPSLQQNLKTIEEYCSELKMIMIGGSGLSKTSSIPELGKIRVYTSEDLFGGVEKLLRLMSAPIQSKTE
ncbi:helix-turn-helix domain-containing protein [Spirochaeta cellobiosiphila]|uniref:helix-turn-helix domain-containing protein n=1 Tax=Spirochaeta cellobiosiphila TaxID=504483 RepID=UPI00040602EE|nr:helix-turn-helix domain-containing protein [Spirochaeta cellobiosiphila]